MNTFLSQIVMLLQNSSGEDTFWMQMLVLVVIGSLVGLGYLIKTRRGTYKNHRQYHLPGTHPSGGQLHRQIRRLKDSTNKYIGFFAKTDKRKFVAEESISAFGTVDPTTPKKGKGTVGKEAEKDLTGGMELLELDFLVSVVENTNGDDKNDVIIRKFSFNELLRRKKLGQVSSNALKVYTIDEGNLYGKEIQCVAMKELSHRTTGAGKT